MESNKTTPFNPTKSIEFVNVMVTPVMMSHNLVRLFLDYITI